MTDKAPLTLAAQQRQKYQRQQIESASQEQLLLMLFDGAIRFLHEAERALGAKDIQTYHNKLIRVQDIISELMGSLDLSLGGELAQNLFRLYEYLHHRLVQANVQKDAALLADVMKHLVDLRATWEQAIQNAAKEKYLQQRPNAENTGESVVSDGGSSASGRDYAV